MRHLLITSGTYVDAELQAEFGPVPPGFLPVGGRPLVAHQLAGARQAGIDRVFLTLPADFAVDEAELAPAALLRLDPTLSLGRSIHAALVAMNAAHAEVLHGDTLIAIPADEAAPDIMSVSVAADGYPWATARIAGGRVHAIAASLEETDPGSHILTGYFRFSDVRLLRLLLERHEFRFTEALAHYVERVPVLALADAGWLDFGHVQTFFRSRHHLAVSRHFNNLSIDGAVVVKSGEQPGKLDAEAAWLRRLPPRLQVYAARLIEDPEHPASGRYTTEYAFLPTVAEIYLSRLGKPGWQRILDAAQAYLAAAASFPPPGGGGGDRSLVTLAIDKTRDRIAANPACYPDIGEALVVNGVPAPTGTAILDHLEGVVRAAPARPGGVMHGDLCFSNLLYNSRSQRLCLIDPRGFVEEGRPTIYGDIRYDIAKLAHSVLGRYDQIVADQHILTGDGREWRIDFPADPIKAWLEDEFLARSLGALRFSDPVALATMVTLFISMIPLHKEAPRRQRAFYINALRLYARFFGEPPCS